MRAREVIMFGIGPTEILILLVLFAVPTIAFVAAKLVNRWRKP
jgi:hypothetical protein